MLKSPTELYLTMCLCVWERGRERERERNERHRERTRETGHMRLKAGEEKDKWHTTVNEE